jgi:hypothetical protein
VTDKRKENEKKFRSWTELPDGGRRYFYEVPGKHDWFARYVKEVNSFEQTTKFYQGIYDQKGNLIEIHEKYPLDNGHKKVLKGEKQ